MKVFVSQISGNNCPVSDAMFPECSGDATPFGYKWVISKAFESVRCRWRTVSTTSEVFIITLLTIDYFAPIKGLEFYDCDVEDGEPVLMRHTCGDFIDDWKNGFFDDRAELLFVDDKKDYEKLKSEYTR